MTPDEETIRDQAKVDYCKLVRVDSGWGEIRVDSGAAVEVCRIPGMAPIAWVTAKLKVVLEDDPDEVYTESEELVFQKGCRVVPRPIED
jgi:hypothetical protein